MNTKHDEDDLDATAELPLLDLQTTRLRYATDGIETAGQVSLSCSDAPESDHTDSLPTLDLSGFTTDTASGWPLVDELLTVRDKIVDLEAALLDAESKLARLDKQHQELQARHVELSAHDAEVIRDRERLDAERMLLLENRKQLEERLEFHRTESAASIEALQRQLDQQQQQFTTERAAHEVRHEHQQVELVRHQQTLQELSTNLLNEQARANSLESDLQNAARARAGQEAAAAMLARNLSHELLIKESLQTALAQREQLIYTLDQSQQQLTLQLADAEARQGHAVVRLNEQQLNMQAQAQQIGDLQNNLTLAEARITRLNEQVESEREHWRSAEQDKERLNKLVNAERDSYESVRAELSGRLAELNALQEQLTQTRTEIAALNLQLTERNALLRTRDELLAEKQQSLQQMVESQAAALHREAALAKDLTVLQEELRQTKIVLQDRVQLLQETEAHLVAERQAKQQMLEQVEVVVQQLQQMEAKQHERDQFILDQARELDQLQHASAELNAQLQQAQSLNETQRLRVQTLEVELNTRLTEQEQQAALLSQVQQELAEKREEQGVSAKQVEALQQELHQHVEALNAIRRDIHQVAQQTRYRDSDLLVRTLTRADDAGVVHLLNKPAMVIGRADDADICIRSDSVSRRHGCLRVGRDVVIIEDLGSTNGCYVNGKRVKRQLLKDGDKLEVGNVMFRFAARVSQA
ncbi:MAG: FHA domain-containing protein [Steroidobacteraceae bacterium]